MQKHPGILSEKVLRNVSSLRQQPGQIISQGLDLLVGQTLSDILHQDRFSGQPLLFEQEEGQQQLAWAAKRQQLNL